MSKHQRNINASDDTVKPYYVYVHRRADDGKVFYVGKGKENRAFRSGKIRRNKHWHNVVAKHGFTAHILMRFNEEKCALSMEVALIKHYGRHNLVNKTDGGEGVSGIETPQHVRDKISSSLKGKYAGENSPNFGRKHSDNARKNMSASKSGERNHNFGKKRSPSTIKKMSEANKGKKKSEETKLLISKNRTGKLVGKDHHQYDDTIYIFHKAGCAPMVCTRYDLMKSHDLPSSNFSAMMKGRRKECGGWSLIGKACSGKD